MANALCPIVVAGARYAIMAQTSNTRAAMAVPNRRRVGSIVGCTGLE
jgi:hypothetical protein